MLNRTKIMRRRRGESGQAITEMAVCLIAVSAVFLGFLLVSSLCITNVRDIIQLRQDVEKSARSGVIGQDGTMISTWNYGNDDIPFTADDTPVSGQAADSDVFASETLDNEKVINLRNPDTLTNVPAKPINDFGDTLGNSDIFVAAAQLLNAEEVNDDPLHNCGLDSTKGMLRSLFGISNFTLENNMMFPVKQISEDL